MKVVFNDTHEAGLGELTGKPTYIMPRILLTKYGDKPASKAPKGVQEYMARAGVHARKRHHVAENAFQKFEPYLGEAKICTPIKVTGVEDITVTVESEGVTVRRHITVGGASLGEVRWYAGVLVYADPRCKQFASNEGYSSADYFRMYKEPYEGKVMHFTDLRYGTE